MLLSVLLIRFISFIIKLVLRLGKLKSKICKSDEDEDKAEVDTAEVANAANGHSALLVAKLVMVMLLTAMFTLLFFHKEDRTIGQQMTHSGHVCLYFETLPNANTTDEHECKLAIGATVKDEVTRACRSSDSDRVMVTE